MKRPAELGPDHPLVEHWDDERVLGNGIIVTLRQGYVFYDDCGVMGFDTPREARVALREVAARPARPGDDP
jgi:hypothetical protein